MTEESTTSESFVISADGTLDFGEITFEISQAIKRQAAKIRLPLGNEKYGLVHITQRHQADITTLGFSSVIAFVEDITRHFTAIYKNNKPNSRNLILLESRGKLKFASIQLELSLEGDFYEVKNATPCRADQFKHKTPLWERNGPIALSEESDLLNPKSPKQIG